MEKKMATTLPENTLEKQMESQMGNGKRHGTCKGADAEFRGPLRTQLQNSHAEVWSFEAVGFLQRFAGCRVDVKPNGGVHITDVDGS